MRELPTVSPFSFPIYASVIKESMMLEDPSAAVERIYHEMFARLNEVTADRPISRIARAS
jgi:ATP-dependent Lhr-like helicase